ncbi:MAG: prealbumin-like fold domain-containing protein [[Ruminococcus] torques]
MKKDEETGNLLSGTEFTVTAAEDITTPDGTVRAEKGTVVDTIVTDTTGIARSKELYLGKYVVKRDKTADRIYSPEPDMGCGAEICRSENRTCKREPYNQESADGNYHRQKGNRNGQAARRRQICHLE